MPDNERLNSFLIERRVTTKELAGKLGLTHAAVSLIRSGRNRMSASTLSKLLEVFPDMCPKWLIKGVGGQSCAANCAQQTERVDTSKDEEILLLRELLQTKNQVIELLTKEKSMAK